MNTYSFTYYTLSDCRKTTYIEAESFELAEAKFWKEYGYAVDKFYKVEMSQVAR